jgi:hypothetical protein
MCIEKRRLNSPLSEYRNFGVFSMRKKGAEGKCPYLGQAKFVGSALSPNPALKKISFKTTGTALSYPPPAAS